MRQPATILGWFVSRWRVETTFQEVRTHLGVETQRQWSDLAILRTTPALLGLFSLITVWADGLARDTATALRPNAAAWYSKQEPTFSDAIAAVRRVLWCAAEFLHVPADRRNHRNSHQLAKSSLPDSMSRRLNCGKSSFDLNDIIDRGIPSRIASNRLRLLHLGRGHDADVSVRSEVLSCEEGYNNNACYKHSKKIGAAKAIMFLPEQTLSTTEISSDGSIMCKLPYSLRGIERPG